MIQKLTILFDLDGTLVDTAPDLIIAHNHVMKKFGFSTKSSNEIKALVGMGAKTMMGKTLWNSAKEELKKVKEKNIKDKMVKEFVEFYGNNILVESKLIKGVKEFLVWCKKNNISMGVCTNKQEHLAIDLLKKIKFLLKDKGMTILGVKNVLNLDINKLDGYNSDSLQTAYYKNKLKFKSKLLLEKIKKLKQYGKKNSSKSKNGSRK